jgi:hypothetical protein
MNGDPETTPPEPDYPVPQPEPPVPLPPDYPVPKPGDLPDYPVPEPEKPPPGPDEPWLQTTLSHRGHGEHREIIEFPLCSL